MQHSCNLRAAGISFKTKEYESYIKKIQFERVVELNEQ